MEFVGELGKGCAVFQSRLIQMSPVLMRLVERGWDASKSVKPAVLPLLTAPAASHRAKPSHSSLHSTKPSHRRRIGLGQH
jgi:hypothetical protein